MSRLIDALSAGDTDAALRALDHDPDAVHHRADGGPSALLLARYRGMTEVVEAIRGGRALDLAEAAAVDDVTTVARLLA